jgi:hypothetical protein
MPPDNEAPHCMDDSHMFEVYWSIIMLYNFYLKHYLRVSNCIYHFLGIFL